MYREPFVLLGYLAAITERITLVSNLLVLPRRQTALGATHVTLNTREVGFTSLAEHFQAIRVFGDALGRGGGLATG